MIPREVLIYIEGQVKSLEKQEERDQWRTAVLSSVIANFAPKSKKGKTYRPKDFMPKKKQTEEDMLKEVIRLNKLFGGKDKRWQM